MGSFYCQLAAIAISAWICLLVTPLVHADVDGEYPCKDTPLLIPDGEGILTFDNDTAPSNKCVWTFLSKEMYLAFTHFKLAPGASLVVYGGNDTKKAPVHGNYSGKLEPFILMVPAPNVTVVLQLPDVSASNAVYSFSAGFNNESGQLTVSGTYGKIQAPVYSNFSGNLNVTYIIANTEEKVRMALTFDQVDLVKGNMHIYDGNTKDKLLRNYSDGATFVGDTVSGRGKGLMVNLLLSAASRPQTNFSAFYIATSTGMDCGGMIDLGSDPVNIVSPGYPNPYPHMANCRWIITSPNMVRMKVEVNDLNLAGATDTLRLLDDQSVGGNVMGTFVKDTIPFSVYLTSYYSLIIQFESDESRTAKGFNLTVYPQVYSMAIRMMGQLQVLPTNTTLPVEDTIYFQVRMDDNTKDDSNQIRLEPDTTNMKLLPAALIDMYDGLNETDPHIGSWVSESPLYPVISNGPNMLIVCKGLTLDGKVNNQSFSAVPVYVAAGYAGHTSVEPSGAYGIQKMAMEPAISTWQILNSLGEEEYDIELDFVTLSIMEGSNVTVYDSLGADKEPIAVLTPTTRSAPAMYGKEFRIDFAIPDTGNSTGPQIDASATYNTRPACGFVSSSSPNGQLTTPDFPNMYPYNAECIWNFVSMEKQPILHISFQQFELYSEHAVTIKDKYSGNGTHASVVGSGKYSGEDMPSDFMIDGLINDTSVQAAFSSKVDPSVDDLQVGQGFSLTYEYLDCGGIANEATKAVQTPKDITSNVTCQWIIAVPPTPKPNDTTINIISYQLSLQDYPSDVTMIEIRDGGSSSSPLVKLPEKNDVNGQDESLSRTNLLWIRYTTNFPANVSAKPASLKIDFKSFACPIEKQCDNGVCLHDDWKCNGIDDCGDGTDEKDCNYGGASSSKGVSGGILAMAIIVTFIVAVLLTIAVPIAYRRLRNPRYSELRDIMSPVDT